MLVSEYTPENIKGITVLTHDTDNGGYVPVKGVVKDVNEEADSVVIDHSYPMRVSLSWLLDALNEGGDAEQLFFISDYLVDRHFGGPEEGGWWYDWYEFSECVVEELPFDVCEQMIENDKLTRTKNRFSVLGGTDRVRLIEDRIRDNESTEHPTYC